ncbi:arginase family protein [Kiloniella sp. EL199]|uniref:arginase family protein n=1 Tax=Kiloniella sp. EL199 TaxID=2107581 RepID=UPI000EA104FB|nr:arginase family protein [Kiloniella sp. EL199]
MSDDDHKKVMEALYWWGLPTLFRCPYEENPTECDIALVGVPHSSGNGTTEKDQHLGPRAVRDVSPIGRRVHGKYQLDPWAESKIFDLGDVPLPEANDNEASIQRITDYYTRLAQRGIPVVSIGGDHSVTGGIIQGLGCEGSKLTKGKKIALLHFDAHTDTFHNLDHWLGAKKSAAHWGSYLVQQGQVDGNLSSQIGIRGNLRTLDWTNTSDDLGYQLITKEQFDEIGIEETIRRFCNRIGDDPVYVTFDLDCLDPSIAPAVSNLEAGSNGFTIDQANSLLRGIRGLNIIGGDVVCLMPTKDNPNKITSMVAMSIMFELICLISDRQRNLR